MMFLWMVIGALLGGIASSGGLFGVLSGAAIGLLWGRQAELSRDLKAIRDRLAVPARTPIAPMPSQPWPKDEARSVMPTPEAPPQDVPPELPVAPPTPAVARAPRPAAPPQPSLADRLLQRTGRWFTEGNVPVKIGMLVLFAGVAALLKYAADAGMLRLPPALRVALIALVAIAGLAFGWHKRQAQRVFALSLQGGAIGVLLITVFAAFRLYGLLPAGAAFALLVVLVAGVGVLAVMQDALALAVLGLLAGFAAPILVSTGAGSHIALFGYYAVLNLAILGIAWKRSWRVLNLLGFIATFAVGTVWGVLRYEPALFASTEPFLILNFLFYLAIPWLHVLRAPVNRKLVIDGCLLFGNPLVSLLLQGALLRWDGKALALSALVAAVIYVVVAYVARRQPAMRLLRDTWAVLAVAFATLAVPLALSADVTGSIFALEGAGLVWLGFRQQRVLARWSGLALQLAAGIALAFDRLRHGEAAWMLLNREFISALLLAAAGWVSSRTFARLGGERALHRVLAVVLYVWGTLWWLLACAQDITRFVPDAWLFGAWLAWLAITAWGAAELARRRWPHEVGQVVAYSPVLWMTLMLALLVWVGVEGQQPLRGWNALAVLVAAIVGWRSLACLRGFAWPGALAHLAWLWRWALLATMAIVIALDRLRWLAGSWRLLLGVAPVLALFVLARWRPRLLASPLQGLLPQWLPPLRHSLVAVLALVGIIALFLDGDPAPLRYIPLLNPVELASLLMAACIAAWLGSVASASWRGLAFGGIVLLLATSFTLRAVHQLAGVPWNDALASSSLAQMSLTVVWSMLGLFAWVWGSRRGQRLMWLAGAIALGVVLLKLLLVDRRHLGNLFGIGSFIAFGVLCSVIGYLAPAPPRRTTSTEETGHAP